MANSRNKRARSAPAPKPTPPSGNTNDTAKGVQTPGGPTAQERYSAYRNLKLSLLLLQAVKQFLGKFRPFLADEVGEEAENLQADLDKNLPIIEAAVEAHEECHGNLGDDAGEGRPS